MMERILLAVMFLSECCILSTCLLRQYHFVDKNLNWTEAQTYCRQTYTDLATVENDEEMNQLINTVSSAGYNSDFWIGLYTEINWRWSDGFTGNGTDYRNWNIHNDEPDFYTDQFWVVSSHDGWFDFHCQSKYTFICYNGSPLDPEFVFVNQKMNWSRAQRYCRENHVDLATVRNHEENQKVRSLVPSRYSSWIGLFRDPHLYWSDGSNFSFSNWDSSPNPIRSLRVMCGFTSLSRSGRWKFSSCTSRLPFICYNVRPAVGTQLVVKLRLKMEDSVDVNDPAVKADLLKKGGHPSRYCVVNQHVPVLALYFDGESDLKPDFRISRRTAAHLIGMLRTPHHLGWSQDLEVLTFLFWLASGTSDRVVSRAFDIPRSTIHDIILRVAEQILSIKKQAISFPTPTDMLAIGAGFAHLAGSPAFSKAVGSIDGCHVRIKPPSADAQCYFNRKLFHSIQLQAVCDHRCQFLDIFIGYPGSVHDSRVLKNSPMFQESLYPPEGYYILGDGGYPCLSQPIAIVTPYREPVRRAVAGRFNRHADGPTDHIPGGPEQQCGDVLRQQIADSLSAPICQALVLIDHDY